MTIAYLANSFPEPLESYVSEEIHELRQRGQNVLACSIKWPLGALPSKGALETLYVLPLTPRLCLQTAWASVFHFPFLREFIKRAVAGPESVSRRVRALAHTWLGVYLATLLRDKNVSHIHVHHGYFSSWVGMVAARILGAEFSMTLHGSDLLLRADYLNIKLRNCRFCVTISDYNRRYILENYPQIDSSKVLVQRLGIDVSDWQLAQPAPAHDEALILTVSRLHAVKNHAFLILACRALKASGLKFRCQIAGEGEEHARLEALISALGVNDEVQLLGHVPHRDLPELYSRADVVVLTSLSEGIPLTLMEAMAVGKLVLAPAVTGIPELVDDGKTGLLYQPRSMDDFLRKLEFLLHAGRSLEGMRQAARNKIQRDFNLLRNLNSFAEKFLERLDRSDEHMAGEANENPLLQQVQLPV
jgi:glycosyltransferase involved in cell wall biosynthesis